MTQFHPVDQETDSRNRASRKKKNSYNRLNGRGLLQLGLIGK